MQIFRDDLEACSLRASPTCFATPVHIKLNSLYLKVFIVFRTILFSVTLQLMLGFFFFFSQIATKSKRQTFKRKHKDEKERKKKKKTHNVKPLQLPETHVKLTFTMLLGLVSSLRFLMLTVVFVTALYII